MTIHYSTSKFIWFIDDDVVHRFLIHSELEDKLYRNAVWMFDDTDLVVSELIKISASKKAKLPQVIFASLGCEPHGGWQLIEELKKLKIEIPVVLFTDNPSRSDQERMKHESMVMDIIAKTNNTAAIMNKVAEYIPKNE